MTVASMPLLGLGTFPLQGEDVLRAVAAALDVGIRHIDTAQMYGNEKQVGAALQASGIGRGEIFVVTKVEPGNLGEVRFLSSVQKSVEYLGGPVDLLLIHWPPPESEVDATIDRLVAAHAAGHAHHIGISNFPTGLMHRAVQRSAVPLINNQIEFHPLIDQSKVLAAARRLGLTLSAYCPLARGAVFAEPVIRQIAAKHGRPASEIALRWIIQQGVAAIPMTTRRENALSNFRALSFTLPEEDMTAISALNGQNRRLVSPSSMTGRWDA